MKKLDCKCVWKALNPWAIRDDLSLKMEKGKHEGLSRYKLKGFSSIKDNTRWLSQPTKLRSQWRLRKAMTRSHFHGRSFYWFAMLHAHTHNHVWHIGDHLTLKMLPLLSALMLSPFSSIEAHISACVWQWMGGRMRRHFQHGLVSYRTHNFNNLFFHSSCNNFMFVYMDLYDDIMECYCQVPCYYILC